MREHLPFELIAAVRFLREGLVQTLLIVVGVAVGVGVIVFMSALLAGVQANFLNRVLSTQAQVVVLPQKDASRPVRTKDGVRFVRLVQSRPQRHITVDQWRKLAALLRATPGVDVISPMASGSVFVIRGAASRTVTFQGVEPDQYFRFVTMPDQMVVGTAHLTSRDMLIGKDLSEDLGIRVADKVLLRTAEGMAETLNVAGIFDLGNKGFNERIVIGTLNTAQGLLGLVGEVSSIDLTLKDPYVANGIADELAAVRPVQADSWIRTNSQFFTAIRSQNVSSATIRASVALSVALGIASVLVVSVVQRSREIGILRAMGASRGQIMRVFLVQGGLLGLAGSFFGSALARLFLSVWQILARNPDGTPFFSIDIQTSLFAMASLLATVCGVLAAMVPALRAARLDPVVAIRG
ncbi:ABC transporter permease [Aureimonas sp. AU4]|uniref:ABC transporter permease n=1 Tax=Aureimonas sp. AU4 TaxID=1638163 RepID=UPI0007808C7B|nr:FtsX-like permease family protein [Aureimonas sp. AU4]